MDSARIATMTAAALLVCGLAFAGCDDGGGDGGGGNGGPTDAAADSRADDADDGTAGNEDGRTAVDVPEGSVDVSVRDSGAQGEKCGDLTDDEPPQPIDNDGDGDANCQDSECLNRRRAVEACYDREVLPTLAPGESVMGVIAPSDEVDQNLDGNPSNDIEYDPFQVEPAAGETVSFEIDVHKPGTLEPKMQLRVEGGGEEIVQEEIEGNGTTPLSFTYEFSEEPAPIINLWVMDRRNAEPQEAQPDLADDAPHGGADFTYTVSMSVE